MEIGKVKKPGQRDRNQNLTKTNLGRIWLKIDIIVPNYMLNIKSYFKILGKS
jgi:hypothetical protein